MVGKVGFCLLLLQQLKMGYATIYNVGEELGWTFNVSSWPIGKNFHAGDILGICLFFSEFSWHWIIIGVDCLMSSMLI